jgi:N-acetyl-1-D-myo-inositol-2-amino-2-deoxy-alpha-D-glucopyranoside deacetylase
MGDPVHGPGAPRAAAARRVLGCFPHPDDEMFASGLLAWCAEHGAEVHLLCATRGERGADRHGRITRDVELAAHRSGELAAACAVLGIAPPAFAELPDGGVATADRAAAVALVRDHVARLRPALVVSLGPDGAYGHRDHLAWTEIVAAAIGALPADQRPRLLQAVFPRGHFLRLYELGRQAGAVAELDPAQLGIEPERVELRLDTRAQAERKLAACRAHDSQLDLAPGSFLRRLLAPLLAEEWYVVAHGPPLPAGARDPFAGL